MVPGSRVPPPRRRGFGKNLPEASWMPASMFGTEQTLAGGSRKLAAR